MLCSVAFPSLALFTSRKTQHSPSTSALTMRGDEFGAWRVIFTLYVGVLRVQNRTHTARTTYCTCDAFCHLSILHVKWSFKFWHKNMNNWTTWRKGYSEQCMRMFMRLGWLKFAMGACLQIHLWQQTPDRSAKDTSITQCQGRTDQVMTSLTTHLVDDDAGNVASSLARACWRHCSVIISWCVWRHCSCFVLGLQLLQHNIN